MKVEKEDGFTENGEIVVILNHKDIIKNAQNGSIKVRTIMNTKYNTMSALDELKEFFAMINNEQQRFFPVTDKTNKLIGAIDVNNVSEFLMLKTNLHSKS